MAEVLDTQVTQYLNGKAILVSFPLGHRRTEPLFLPCDCGWHRHICFGASQRQLLPVDFSSLPRFPQADLGERDALMLGGCRKATTENSSNCSNTSQLTVTCLSRIGNRRDYRPRNRAQKVDIKGKAFLEISSFQLYSLSS